MVEPGSARLVDARGVKCPLPALWTERALREMASGQRLIVEATDPVSIIDIPNIVRQCGARVIAQTRGDDGLLRFEIEKNA